MTPAASQGSQLGISIVSEPHQRRRNDSSNCLVLSASYLRLQRAVYGIVSCTAALWEALFTPFYTSETETQRGQSLMAQKHGPGIQIQVCPTPSLRARLCTRGHSSILPSGLSTGWGGHPGLQGKVRFSGGSALKGCLVLCFSKALRLEPQECHLTAASVLLADKVPQVTVQPPSTVQKLGGTVILGCVVEPPGLSTTWRLNGRELNGSDDALGVLITRGTLVITALNSRTVGRYQCVARMPAGAVASVPATVTLASECCSFAPRPWCGLSSSLPVSLVSLPSPPSHSYPPSLVLP